MERRDLLGEILLGEMGVVIIVLIATAAAGPTVEIVNSQISEQNQLKKFSSYEELENFVRASVGYRYRAGYELPLPLPAQSSSMAPSVVAPGLGTGGSYDRGNVKYNIIKDGEASVDYSTTNIQVEGVDEADIVKTDGRYLYVLSKGKVIILVAYPPEEAKVLSTIELGETPSEIFVNNDRLVVFEESWNSSIHPRALRYSGYSETVVKIYDISNRENPVLVDEIILSGDYFNSRMIGNFVYVVVNMPVDFKDNVIPLPDISSSSGTKKISATEIYYFEDTCYPYVFAIVAAIDIQSARALEEKVFLTTQAHTMYVSLNNIYITYTNYPYANRRRAWEKTIVYKISIANGKIEYKSQGEVLGRILNQFSMDEHQGHFRIATTTGWYGANHVYVLDGNLNIVGKLGNLAPGERIYSARFIDKRAYLVTFKKIDPLFVIDLENPYDPRILGELKIPGYSDYLHPYDETHVIGIGKDTVDMGSFAWYQGVKIALFDVSDPENPIEISKYVIGDRGTDSYALSDHKAFLFSRSKNLLVIPIELAEIDRSKYPSGVPPNVYGDRVWQGAYVFHISVEDGLVLKGRISHSDNTWLDQYYFVKRSLFIDDVLYTISDESVKMNDLESLDEIGKVSLSPPYDVEMTGWRRDYSYQSTGMELGSMIGLFAAIWLVGCSAACIKWPFYLSR